MAISISKYRAPEEILLIQTRAVMKSSFEAQFADYRHFHRHWMGTVTVLVGTSTAGKTSIVEALKQANSNLIEDGLDLREISTFLKLFKRHSPDAVAALTEKMEPLSIYKAVFTQKRSWRPTISDSEKTDAESNIQQIKDTFDLLPPKEINALFENMEFEMFDEAFERSTQGLSSIFDVVRIDNFVRHRMMKPFTGPLKVALIYCPLHTLSSRMEKRNREAEENGDLGNQRVGIFPFAQFGELYTQKEQGQQTLEKVTREQAISIIDKNFDTEHPDAQIHMGGKEKIREIFLNQLGFAKEKHEVEIAPRTPHLYHLLIDSSKQAALKSAEIIQKKSTY